MSAVRICIVDDDAWVLEFLRTVVAHAITPSCVETTRSALEALQRLTGAEYQLLLSDVEMPDMSGIELTRHVVKLTRTPAIVLMTDNPTLLPWVIDAGAYSCVPKPIRLDFLTSVLQRALDFNSLQRRVEKLRQILTAQTQSEDYYDQVRVRIAGVERRMAEMRNDELAEIRTVWKRLARSDIAS